MENLDVNGNVRQKFTSLDISIETLQKVDKHDLFKCVLLFLYQVVYMGLNGLTYFISLFLRFDLFKLILRKRKPSFRTIDIFQA